MATAQPPSQFPMPDKTWESRTYLYYSRQPALKMTKADGSWRKRLRRITISLRIAMAGVIALIVGGVFPLILSYELAFRPLLRINCSDCQIMDPQPYIEFNYVIATALGVLGLMMPIFVLYIIIKIVRSRSLRHDLFD